MNSLTKKIIVFVLFAILLIGGCAGSTASQKDQASSAEEVSESQTIEASDEIAEESVSSETASSEALETLTYEAFKALSNEEQIAVFEKLSSKEIYDLVKSSDSENWPVTAYDLVTEENAKDFIILNEYNGSLSFNLDWPIYGGYLAETIASVGDLSGTVEVSRDGGDGGYTMCFGRNEDGTLANNSQRSIPKTTATVRTGLLDIDRYKEAVDIITGEEYEKETEEETDSARIAALQEMGFDEENAINLLSDYNAWLTRSEIVGENNIAEGAKSVGHQVEARYGYYGKTAPWKAGDLELSGGSDQMNTVFSWGTLNSSGLITEAGTETIY